MSSATFEPAPADIAELTQRRAQAGSYSPTVAVSVRDRALRHRVDQALTQNGLALVVSASELDEMLIGFDGVQSDVVVCAVSATPVELSSVRRLHDLLPALHIVLVVPPSPRPRLRTLIDAGAEGVVVEPRIATALAAAVRAACCGQVSVPSEFSGSIERSPLTHRQRQVLRLMVLGQGNAEIARALYLSESTVKGHLSAAFARLGVRSRADAAALILDPDAGCGLGILETSRPRQT